MQGLFKYITSARALSENWTRRLPRQFVIGFTGNRPTEAIDLLRRTFSDADLVEKSPDGQDATASMHESLSRILNNSNKQLIIQEFPFSYEHATEYEAKTDGINLFINFTGILFHILSLGRIRDHVL